MPSSYLRWAQSSGDWQFVIGVLRYVSLYSRRLGGFIADSGFWLWVYWSIRFSTYRIVRCNSTNRVFVIYVDVYTHPLFQSNRSSAVDWLLMWFAEIVVLDRLNSSIDLIALCVVAPTTWLLHSCSNFHWVMFEFKQDLTWCVMVTCWREIPFKFFF